jgi:hypothetical protein
VESFDIHPSNQYNLVRVISSCFLFVKMCLCKPPVKVQHEILDIFLRELHSVYMDGGRVFLRMVNVNVNVMWTDLDLLAFFLHFLNQFCIASRLVCKQWLSIATTAVSSAKVAVVDSGEVGGSAVYSRYNNCHRTLPWGTPALTDDSSVYMVSTFTRKCLLWK